MYTNNNPLTYILTMAKLDAASHRWVVSLTNYNLRLYNQAGGTNIHADALLRVSWLGCVPDNSGIHLRVTAAAVLAMQEASLKGLTSPMDDTVVICMSYTQCKTVSRSPA